MCDLTALRKMLRAKVLPKHLERVGARLEREVQRKAKAVSDNGGIKSKDKI